MSWTRYFFSQTISSYFHGIRMTALWMKVVPCVYIFLEQYGFGPFSHGEIFFTPYRTQGCRSGGGGRSRGLVAPPPPPPLSFLQWILSQSGGVIMPTTLIRAFWIFRPSYGSASCFRSKFFLPSCPRLGDIEKDKYTWRWGFFRVSGTSWNRF